MQEWNTLQPLCLLCVIGIVISLLQENDTGLIRDFSCITYNWDKVVCRWNSSESHVGLYWKPIIPFSSWYHCPRMTNTSCTWDVAQDTIDIHRQINIRINVSNQLQSFIVRWNESVLPEPVYNLNAVPVNELCLLIKWNHRDYIHNKTFKIEYKSMRNSKENILQFYSENSEEIKTICNLSPYTSYEVDVSCKPANKGLWSKSRRKMVTTNKTVPDGPPNIFNGGFAWRKAMPYRTTNLTIYWNPLNTSRWNDDRIQYKVYLESRTEKISRKDGSEFYATFEVKSDETHNASIYSKNEIGKSSPFTVWVLPYSEGRLVEDVFAIVDGNTMHLIWKPLGDVDVVSYNLFWCEHAFGDVCKSMPHTIQVTDETTLKHSEYIIESKSDVAVSYLVGVSYTTYNNITVGFIWSDCYFVSAKEFQIKLKLTFEHVVNGVVIKWRLSKCHYQRIKEFLRVYFVHICTDKSCEEYEEHKIEGNRAFFPVSERTVCVRVFPEWNDTHGDTATIECVHVQSDNGIIKPILVAVGVVLLILTLFGFCMIARKLKKTVKTIKRPYTIEVPVINSNQNRGVCGNPGLPLLQPSSIQKSVLLKNREGKCKILCSSSSKT